MQFIDLKAQYAALRGEINANIQAVLDSAQFIGGPQVKQLEQELVEQLSDADITAAVKDLTMQKKPKAKPVHYDEVDMAQMSLFDTVQDDDIIKELSELDISNMTPMDALNTLYRFQGKVKNRWK